MEECGMSQTGETVMWVVSVLYIKGAVSQCSGTFTQCALTQAARQQYDLSQCDINMIDVFSPHSMP